MGEGERDAQDHQGHETHEVDASRSGWLVDRAGAVVGASGISVVVMAGVLGAGRPRHIWRQAPARRISRPGCGVVASASRQRRRPREGRWATSRTIRTTGRSPRPARSPNVHRHRAWSRPLVRRLQKDARTFGASPSRSRARRSLPEPARPRRRRSRVSSPESLALTTSAARFASASGGPASTAPGTPCPGCRLRSRHAGRRARRAGNGPRRQPWTCPHQTGRRSGGDATRTWWNVLLCDEPGPPPSG